MIEHDVSANSIRELRKRLGLTQEEFAHAVAVTFSTVNRWENGHAKPSKLARRAIEALHVTPASDRGPTVVEKMVGTEVEAGGK
jgi:DNA-binding transcriptional regulator YiaG